MEIGRASGYIYSATAYADSPAWLPADERWKFWVSWLNGYSVLKLTCRNHPAAPPPPAASMPACTFALHADAPIDIYDAVASLAWWGRGDAPFCFWDGFWFLGRRLVFLRRGRMGSLIPMECKLWFPRTRAVGRAWLAPGRRQGAIGLVRFALRRNRNTARRA